MTRRSIHNERNNAAVENEKTGATRKSASSAKPKRDLASTVYQEPKPKKKGRELKEEQKAKEQQRARRIAARSQAEGRKKITGVKSPEEKKWTRIWWGALVGVLVVFALAFLIGGNNSYVFWGCMIVAYIEVGFAFWIQFSKIQKLQKQRQNLELSRKVSRKEYNHLIAKQEAEEREKLEKSRRMRAKIPIFGKKYAKDEELDVPMK
ncbi:MAG: hypothetical protein K6G78_04260 [bacterium]|nr:hypothetical protein [bacterium]